MLHLTRAIDRATGYVFVPPKDTLAPEGTIDSSVDTSSARPNAYGLFSTAAAPIPGDVRDVQERWIDAREAFDAFEKRGWRKEGEIVREQASRDKAEAGKISAGTIRERK